MRVSNEEVAALLAGRGLRLTRQRKVVLDAVRASGGHPAAHEIYQRARRVLPQISLGTVYRTLAVLRDAGVVRELHLREAQGRYEEEGEHHHHVVCTECGHIEDIAASTFEGLTSQARAATEFDIKEHRLEFYGICPRCRATPDPYY
jgi:Fur family ferric uptake transcriptional regulator/Fur family peroxide stress response transcriptional regulator